MEGHARGSVLVVDDEPTIAEVVSRYLERAGYSATTAADGLEAVRLAGEEVQLSQREFDLLEFFASNPGQAFSRDQLLDRVWGTVLPADTGTVTVHVRRLRAKIEPDPERPRFIQTLWGVGYRFQP